MFCGEGRIARIPAIERIRVISRRSLPIAESLCFYRRDIAFLSSSESFLSSSHYVSIVESSLFYRRFAHILSSTYSFCYRRLIPFLSSTHFGSIVRSLFFYRRIRPFLSWTILFLLSTHSLSIVAPFLFYRGPNRFYRLTSFSLVEKIGSIIGHLFLSPNKGAYYRASLDPHR
jgi:hypothetical protein